MLFDTHAHLLSSQFDGDRDDVIAYIQEQGVTRLVEAGTDLQDSARALDLAQQYQGIYAAAGIHPHEAAEAGDFRDALTKLLQREKCVAVGEIGLDYHYDFSPRDVQKQVFAIQLEMAQQFHLPVVIHDREAHGDIYDILLAHRGVTGVMHCFSGSVESAKNYIRMGWYLSFGGTLTFKNAVKAKEVAAWAPLDRIVCETDCPYLTPVPHRGKRNDPSMVRYVVDELARVRNTDAEEIEHAVYQNANRLFLLTV